MTKLNRKKIRDASVQSPQAETTRIQRELIAVDDMTRVAELYVEGKTTAEIAKELHLPMRRVYDLISEWFTASRLHIQELGETWSSIKLAQLEKIQSGLMPFCLPQYDTELDMEMPPDPRYVKLLIDLIRAQKDIMDAAMKHFLPKEKGGVSSVNVEHMEVTISSQNPLYTVAVENMEEDFVKGFADLDLRNLYEDPQVLELAVGEYIEAELSEISENE